MALTLSFSLIHILVMVSIAVLKLSQYKFLFLLKLSHFLRDVVKRRNICFQLALLFQGDIPSWGFEAKVAGPCKFWIVREN